MRKMSINDAAAHFGVSKEAIHNRIRRGSLAVVVESGVKMVEVDVNAKKAKTPRASSSSRAAHNSDRYYKLLEEQNAKLQSRVETLESETRTLRDQKELMLIEERKKIEQIYKEKDEQLKNILSSISSQFMLNAPSHAMAEIESEDETLEVEIAEVQEENEKPKSKVVSLKKYLKKLKTPKKRHEKIMKRFKKLAKKDERIIIYDKKLYVDIKQFNYDDLL